MYKPYSHSRITCFNTCPYKFKYKYIDNIEMQIDSPALIKGKAVHEFLETKFKDNKEIYPELEDKQLQTEVNKIIKDKLPNNFLYNKLLNECEVVGTELQVGLTEDFKPVSYENGFYRGSIDILAKHKATNKYFILDWKTGKSKNTIPELDQVGLYAIYVMQHLGIIDDIVGFYNYIEHNVYLKKVYNQNEINKLKELYSTNIAKINSEKSFHKNITPLCNWCEYKELCHTNG